MARQPPWRLAPWLLLVMATVICRAAADSYTLAVEPVWSGHVKPGVPSELGLRLLAPHGGHARLTVRAARTVVSGDGLFEAGLPLQMHLPLTHDTALPVTVELAINGQAVDRLNQDLHVLPASTRVVAVANPDDAGDWPAAAMLPADATVLYVAANDMPYHGQTYQLLSALFLAESALQSMTVTQRQAVAEYAAGCGVLYLSGVNTLAAQELRAIAGCGARNLLLTPPASTIAPTPGAVSRLPADATLGLLIPEGNDPVLRSVVTFLVGYVLVLLLVARSATRASALLILPLTATAVAVLGWSLASPRIQLASLAEMDSGDPVARFSALLQVTGAAPRETLLGLPAQLGLPSAPDPGQSTVIDIEAGAQRFDLRLDTKLMSRHAFRVQGIARGAPVAVAGNASGVRVTNRGDTPSAAAILAWQGRRYTVPVLAAGQQWSQPDEGESWGQSAAEQLLRQRATDGSSWLLLPHDIPALTTLTGTGDSTGWLLVRGVADV